MQLKHNYYYFIKAIPITTCEKILEAGRKKITNQAITGIEYKEGKLNLKARDCRVSWLKDKWIYDIINPFISTANEKAGWNFQLDWHENSQFTIYEKGQYFNWHTDQGTKAHVKHPSKNIKGKIRKLSLTLQLTDRADYEGGDFQFRWLDDNKKDFINIVTVDDAKDMGTIIIFPSFIWHQILPITKGKRESLVNWTVGKKFK